MPDAIFDDPRLAGIYDWLEVERPDLDVYVNMADEFAASAVLDVGCGTGTLCTMLAARGFTVVGVDPAVASLDVARSKREADLVRWIHGDASKLPTLQVDLAMMTGNVAQVFLSDADWINTLAAVHRALRPGGPLVFETRDPARQAWLQWTREHTHTVTTIPGIGEVTGWCDLLEVCEPFVSFRWTYEFAENSEVITSDSTLRFRTRSEIEESLTTAGYVVEEIRDAPDRPGHEFVFIART